MTFFQLQQQARRRTGYLVFLYILSVIFIIFGVYLAVMGAWFMGTGSEHGTPILFSTASFWNGEAFMWIAGLTSALIFIGTVTKIFALAKGGQVVATMLGGRLVNPATRDPVEKKLLNIVEEMSIASGVPVPPVYVMDDEPGINAFAAGYKPTSAIVCVSDGALRLLNRDELQGVIAHEFSHILNGDMALNIKLIGVLNGLLLIALTGRFLIRISGNSSRLGRRSSRNSKGGGGVIVLGLMLMALGYLGILFGRLIKSAVSREREYLADASAVQFTRLPDGIAGALMKIGGLVYGSRIESHKAEEASHMFFANGLGKAFLNMFATHPPLKDRIRAIYPRFNGEFPVVQIKDVRVRVTAEAEQLAGIAGLTEAAPAGEAKAPGSEIPFEIDTDRVHESVGRPNAENFTHAKALLSTLPSALLSSLRDPYGAQAVCYSLLLNEEDFNRDRQLNMLFKVVDEGMQKEITTLSVLTRKLGREHHLPLVELCIQSLRGLSREQYLAFRKNCLYLMDADQKCTLFEYTVLSMFIRHLDTHFKVKRKGRRTGRFGRGREKEAERLIYVISLLGNEDKQKAFSAYSAGAAALGTSPELSLSESRSADISDLDDALHALEDEDYGFKDKLVKAVIECIAADKFVTMEEAELLRAIGSRLDCPVPPIPWGIMDGNLTP